MDVSHKVFFDLENSLASRLKNSFSRANTKIIKKIASAIGIGDFTEAYRLVNLLDNSKVVKNNEKFIELLTISAALLGISRLTKVKDSTIFSQGKPQTIITASNTFAITVGVSGAELVRKQRVI